MMERRATTPFAGKVTGQMLARQAHIARQQEDLRRDEGNNKGGPVDKWQLLRHLTEARHVYGISDRTISVLEAMISFAPERHLDGKAPVIVFPSNRELAFRSRGMAPATIRRHVARLVELGFILRRDSANGKRFCRHDRAGMVEDAFGFDLAPFVLRADEIYAYAEKMRQEAEMMRKLRSEISVYIRDISKIIELALEEKRQGDWLGMYERYQALRMSQRHDKSLTAIAVLAKDLKSLLIEVENLYLSSLNDNELSSNDADNEQHYHISKTELHIDNKAEKEKQEDRTPKVTVGKRQVAVTVNRLKSLFPSTWDYAKDGIQDWKDFIVTTDIIRSVLGVSFDAWCKAKDAMGDQSAAICVAFILEKAENIRSPGGYLRVLTEKAEAGRFSVYALLSSTE
ncbi:replication initiation protein RepC [Allorhizobium sp. BGMRC 0089]|uniref:plasmid replication protein RepC n=1 Tax=Allorhizobium sonneratiae TaxID=2934936 RepID=UPI00203360F6|nr:plasmid replication protein RepC [Allorhizobium sonneratiae]MCM2293180.1 replication initiation protein RepC [Allorhizobium sonneratiae]